MLSLTAIGHSWWVLLELVTLACALLSVFTVLATALSGKRLALAAPLVLLLVESALTLTIAWGHGAVIRGSNDAGAQYLRLLGLSAVIPLLLDLGVVLWVRSWRSRGSAGTGAKEVRARGFVRLRGQVGSETPEEPPVVRRVLNHFAWQAVSEESAKESEWMHSFSWELLQQSGGAKTWQAEHPCPATRRW